LERYLNTNRQSDSFTSLEIAPRNSNHIPDGTRRFVTVMSILLAKQYLAYARECLGLAEKAETPEIRETMTELSRAWMTAARAEEKYHFKGLTRSVE
jgi:hypothetical protein